MNPYRKSLARIAFTRLPASYFWHKNRSSNGPRERSFATELGINDHQERFRYAFHGHPPTAIHPGLSRLYQNGGHSATVPQGVARLGQSTAFAAELRRQIEFQQELKEWLGPSLVDGVITLLSIQLRESSRGQSKTTEPVQPAKCLVLDLANKSETALVNLLMAVVTVDGLTTLPTATNTPNFFKVTKFREKSHLGPGNSPKNMNKPPKLRGSKKRTSGSYPSDL